MSIENEVKKLTTAINRICEYIDAQGVAPVEEVMEAVKEAVPAVVAAQPVPQPQPAGAVAPLQPQVPPQPAGAVAPLQPQVPPQPGAPVQLDDNSINQFLITEAARLGETGGPKILALMNQFGASRITDVPLPNRSQLVAAVLALV